MVSEKFMIRFNFVVNLIILSSIVFGGLIWADSNGIWHLAEDVRPGTFGADEGFGPFTFNGTLYFLKSIFAYGLVTISNTLNVASTTGRAIWAESSVDDGVAGVTSASGKSAIYGWSKNSDGYSGFFEGGKFMVDSSVITFGTKTNCGKLYTDASGNVLCGSESQNLNSVLSRGNNGGGQRINNIAPADSNDDAPNWGQVKSYVDNNLGRLAIKSGVANNGDIIALPFFSDGVRAIISQCHIIVSPYKTNVIWIGSDHDNRYARLYSMAEPLNYGYKIYVGIADKEYASSCPSYVRSRVGLSRCWQGYKANYLIICQS